MNSHTFRILLSAFVVVLVVYHYYPHLLKNSNPAIVATSTPASASSTLSAKSKLSPEAYYVMYEAGTEHPYTSPLLDEHRKGTFVSADTGKKDLLSGGDSLALRVWRRDSSGGKGGI